jgi:hypothetical protein
MQEVDPVNLLARILQDHAALEYDGSQMRRREHSCELGHNEGRHSGGRYPRKRVGRG